ncbi:MAG: 4-alpha-glucanotransferase [Clostridia bacterium]|nr:4-alpha-glucanotransferase [Clostridia bacterium]
MERKFGILMPVFSLGEMGGVGTFGKEAYRFVDFLSACNVSVWQILPLCPVGYGGSPYSSPCCSAIAPHYIDLDILANKGLLKKSEYVRKKFGTSTRVDYASLDKKTKLLKKAFTRYTDKLNGFYDYALYMALKEFNGGKPWNEWGECAEYSSQAVKDFAASHGDEIAFWQFVQAEAFLQWQELKRYANGKGVKIMGDLPFYVAYDSVEVWKNKKFFDLDGFVPKKVAGVPPDYFSKSGQLWGNPVYKVRSAKVKRWWNERLSSALELYDSVRLDHFRAFDEFYAVPYGREDAIKGRWKKGFGYEFFIGKKGMPIVAEDLGIITQSVRDLLVKTGFPGMRVLQFGFSGGDNPHLPSAVRSGSVCYTGTHDNMTLVQFLSSLSESEKEQFTAILQEEWGSVSDDVDELADVVIELCCMSDAHLAIVPLFDLLHKGEDGRINTPSTVSADNWSARIQSGEYEQVREDILYLVNKYNRG